MSLDRNAKDQTRLRRNAQRTRSGNATADIKTTAPIVTASGRLTLSLSSTGGLQVTANLLALKLANGSLTSGASGVSVVVGPGLVLGGAGIIPQVSWNETPGGTVDGTNAAFTLAHTPTAAGAMVFVNGLLASPTTDYTLSGATVTFQAGHVPAAASVLRASYSF